MLNPKKLIKFALITFLVSSVVVTSNSWTQKQLSQAIEPKMFEPCLPKIDAQTFFSRKQIGFIDYHNKKYYVFSIVKNVQVPPFDDWYYKEERITVVSVDHIGCLVQLPEEKYGKATMEKFVPQELARKIAFLIIKDQVEQAGGVQGFLDKRIQDSFGEDYGEPEVFFPEILWAWKQLGIPLPSDYEVIRDLSDLDDGTYSPMYE